MDVQLAGSESNLLLCHQAASMSFDSLIMPNVQSVTSVTFESGLKGPPPLAVAAKYSADDKEGSTTSSDSEEQLQPKATMPSPRKSVEFLLHPPAPKRAKVGTSWTSKQVVDAISTSIAPHERLEAIQKTKEALNHESQQGHDEEIAAGTDSVLVKHLAFILTLAKSQIDSDPELFMTELSLILESLELLYRASSSIVGASFRRMGPSLMQLLKTVVTDEVSRRTKRVQSTDGKALNKQESENSNTEGENEGRRPITPPVQERLEFEVGTPEGDLILKKATRIFGHFARVGEATKPMAQFPGFIDGLVHIISLQPYDNLPWEARLSALWCIANLACNGENMPLIAKTPGLFNALIQVSHRPLHSAASLEQTMEVLRARSIASRAILNLSWSTENKEILASNTDLIDLLTGLVLRRTTPLVYSRTVRDILATTRRHAVGAIRNLAAAPRASKLALCDYKGGHVLDVLTEAALNDPDQSVIDRAFAAINNLAIHDTAVQIVSHPALVMALKDVLMSADETDNAGGTPKSHASATLLVLERSIRPDMPEYESLKGLLESMSAPETNAPDVDSEMDGVEPTAV